MDKLVISKENIKKALLENGFDFSTAYENCSVYCPSVSIYETEKCDNCKACCHSADGDIHKKVCLLSNDLSNLSDIVYCNIEEDVYKNVLYTDEYKHTVINYIPTISSLDDWCIIINNTKKSMQDKLLTDIIDYCLRREI